MTTTLLNPTTLKPLNIAPAGKTVKGQKERMTATFGNCEQVNHGGGIVELKVIITQALTGKSIDSMWLKEG